MSAPITKTFSFEKDTKNFSKFTEDNNGINKLYLPLGAAKVKQVKVTIEPVTES